MDLAERILNSVKNSDSALWFPELTRDLAKVAWNNLEEKGITPANYGTARVVLNDPAGPRNILASVSVNGPEQSKIAFPIELLPSDISRQYKESNVTFYLPENITHSTVLKSLGDAFEIIRTVPTLFDTVSTLVKSLHLIEPESDEYDISFSEPDVPFSIFVSVPGENNEINALRIAEAIVHEAMHLQLTLIERITPLVANNREGYFSPWRQEYRTLQGIMHALYVFRIIEAFLTQCSTSLSQFSDGAGHIKQRCIQIREEIKQINVCQFRPDLTPTGSILTNLVFTSRKMGF